MKLMITSSSNKLKQINTITIYRKCKLNHVKKHRPKLLVKKVAI